MNNGGIDLLYGDAELPVTALDGADIIIGDNGKLDFGVDGDVASLDLIRSHSGAMPDGLGGRDVISGNAQADVGIGSSGNDTIYGDDESAGAAVRTVRTS